MKTTPDDITLTQWMDGKLHGQNLQEVKAWAQEHPEVLAERDAIRTMNANIQELLPKVSNHLTPTSLTSESRGQSKMIP